MLQIASSFYRAKTVKMVTSISLSKIIFVFAPTNRCDFAIVSFSQEVETLSAKTAAKTEDLLCFFDLFESFSSIMSPGNRNKLRQLLRLRLLYMRLQRLRSRSILPCSGESVRCRQCSQRTFNFHRQTRGKCKHNQC